MNSTDLVDSVKGEIDNAKDVLTRDPSTWTTEEIIGVAVGGILFVFVVYFLYKCCCCCRRKDKNSYKLARPYVERSPGNKVNASTRLPLGAILHGAEKLAVAGLDGTGVRVGVIDSGIDKDHPGFDGQVKKQEWYRSGTPLDVDDHGTHVAGTIHFMAPQAELFDYRVFGDSGDMDGDTAIATAIKQACDDGCQVINMSLRVSFPIKPGVYDAIKYAASKNVIMVCAAGNSGDGDPTTNELYAYPARWKQTLSVAAVKKAKDLPVAYFSESNPQVDFAGTYYCIIYIIHVPSI